MGTDRSGPCDLEAEMVGCAFKRERLAVKVQIWGDISDSLPPRLTYAMPYRRLNLAARS